MGARVTCVLAASLLITGCFVTTDENLWKQRKEAGPDVSIADASWSEAAADHGPGLDGGFLVACSGEEFLGMTEGDAR